MFCGRISVNSVLLLLLVRFFSFDVYIPYQKCQVKPHTSSWFSADCAAAIVNKNHFFHLCQEDKSSGSKVKFRQASNCCRRVLEAAKLACANKTKESKLACANKTKESITSQKLGSRDFWRIANSVLSKGKSAIPPLFNSLEVLIKQNCLLKTFLKTLILMTQVSLYLFSLLELI